MDMSYWHKPCWYKPCWYNLYKPCLSYINMSQKEEEEEEEKKDSFIFDEFYDKIPTPSKTFPKKAKSITKKIMPSETEPSDPDSDRNPDHKKGQWEKWGSIPQTITCVEDLYTMDSSRTMMYRYIFLKMLAHLNDGTLKEIKPEWIDRYYEIIKEDTNKVQSSEYDGFLAGIVKNILASINFNNRQKLVILQDMKIESKYLKKIEESLNKIENNIQDKKNIQETIKDGEKRV